MHAINWFEIPTRDLAQARRFYEQVLGSPLREDADFPGLKMALLPYAEPGIGGALVQGRDFRPHADGVRVYLNGGEDLAPIVARVAAAGGRVVLPKTFVRADIGYIALFCDPDGNVVGLHSPR
jgi:predicted enzyme related to lactoylglutathione lyase